MEITIPKETARITEFIPTITLVIIVLAFFNLYSFYSFYGIDISSYIDATEIIFSFSSLFYSVFLLTATAIFVYSTTEYSAPLHDWMRERQWYFKLLYALVAFGIQLAVLMGFSFFLFGFTMHNILIDLVPLMIILLIYMMVKIAKPSLSTKIWLTFFIAIVFIHYRNWEDYRKIVVNKRPRFDVTINYSDKVIKSNGDLLYINSTQNYAFFWRPSIKSVQSYSLENVDSFVIKNLEIFDPKKDR